MIDDRSPVVQPSPTLDAELNSAQLSSSIGTMLGAFHFLWMRWAYVWLALATTVTVAATFAARMVHPSLAWVALAAMLTALTTVFVLPGGTSDGPASPAFVRAALRHARKPAAHHLADVLAAQVATSPDQLLTRLDVLIALWDAERATDPRRLRRQERREQLLLAQRATILACQSDLDLDASHKV